jgi:hypothetical protein
VFRDRRDLAGLPLSARRIHLEDVIAGASLVLPVRRLAANGLDAWAQVVGNGYEGYVAKDVASAYEGGATRYCEGVWTAVALLRELQAKGTRAALDPAGLRTTKAGTCARP